MKLEHITGFLLMGAVAVLSAIYQQGTAITAGAGFLAGMYFGVLLKTWTPAGTTNGTGPC